MEKKSKDFIKIIKNNLQEGIKKAKPNMDKIQDVDKHLDEIENGI